MGSPGPLLAHRDGHRWLQVLAALALLVTSVGATGVTAASASGRGETRIAWSQFSADGSSAHIVSSTPAGRDVRILTRPASGEYDFDPTISPDGARVAFERDIANGPAVVGIVDADGEHTRVLDLGCVAPCASTNAPSWTPDGRHLVFQRVVGPFDLVNHSAHSAVLYSANIDGSGQHRLSEPGIDGTYEDGHARFAPRGYIVFGRVHNADLTVAVFRMQPDGTDVHQLTPWALGGDLPDVSLATRGPTKDLVVFETYGFGPPSGRTQNIATVPATCTTIEECTTKIRPVTDNGAGPNQSFNPTWSPDGRMIAYVEIVPAPSNSQPPSGDIWTIDPNGLHRRQVSHSPLFDFRPSWGIAD